MFYALFLATFSCLLGAVLLLGLELAREIWRDADWFEPRHLPETGDADRAATRSASES